VPKKSETRRPLTGADGEVRQLTRADIAKMRPARDVLPAELLAVLPKRRPGQRGSQKTPTKKQITLRLDETHHQSLPRPRRWLAVADQRRSEKTDGREMTGVHLAAAEMIQHIPAANRRLKETGHERNG
jgi:uncharacterized protein (DUF4415 family)